MKQLTEAERSGNRNPHLETRQTMDPIFHSTGHYQYAKYVRTYLQQIRKLKDIMDRMEFEKFTEVGLFTIRRKFWSGIWTNMTIEKISMKSMKSCGGLTRGRGVSDSLLAEWVLFQHKRL